MLLYHVLEKFLTLIVPKLPQDVKMFGISDIGETVTMSKDRFVKTCMSNGSTVCKICCSISGQLVKLFFLLFLTFHCYQFFGE